MVWRSDAPQGAEAEKVRHEVVQYFKGDCIDLGCGPRKIFPARHLIGVDNNRDAALFQIQARPDIYADCSRLAQFADASFDCVFSSHLLEHCDDYRATLAEWWRLVRTGGVLILYLPHADWYPTRGMPGANPDHKHDFRNDDIRAAMQETAWRSGQGWQLERDEVRCEGAEYSFLQVYRKGDNVKCETALPTMPPKGKSLGVVRLGAYGDALWISSILPALKAEGWHITLYTQRQGETSLRHDPNIDRMVVQPDGIFGITDTENARMGFPEVGTLQSEHLLALARKHDRFINLIGTVEGSLLPHMSHPNYWLPDYTRRATMNRNYVETVHAAAGVPFDRNTVRVRFYPSAEEANWARAERAKHKHFVMLNPIGSSAPKFWPHAQQAMELLAAQGVGGVLVGDLRDRKYTAPAGWTVAGTEWDLRRVFALAALADVVVGVESAVVNSVAQEAPLKIVLLSHSTAEQLTRDWTSTIALQASNLPCYPCHRIHLDFRHCTQAPDGAAACASAMDAETVVGYALQWIRHELKIDAMAEETVLEAA